MFNLQNTGCIEKSLNKRIDNNAESLVNEIKWFVKVVNARLHESFPEIEPELSVKNKENNPNQKFEGNGRFHIAGLTQSAAEDNYIPQVFNIPPPDLDNDGSIYADFVRYYKMTVPERLLLILALIPHLQPHLLDVFFSVKKSTGRGYTEFGGIKGNQHGGFIPTIETALFILGGNNLGERFRLYKLFEPDHFLSAHGIISLTRGTFDCEPFYASSIGISEEYVDFFTTGNLRKPQFSMEFPAKRITTQMEWEDLVVDDITARQLDELRIWLEHGQVLYRDWGMGKKLKPGYKALFHGGPGTGKTLTAALLGKLYDLDVYRIDLSMVISKYIGDTEKNLEKVFKKAENKNWILFFDEADALFGKRTSVNDAHDKYANQEIAYLLQRLEDYPGLVVLASNMRNNVDEAFTRRLQAIIYFPKPRSRERLRLWQGGFSPVCKPPRLEELERIAQQYEMSGGSIMNAIQYASLLALNRNDTTITEADIILGIKNEYNKEGRTI
jgi:AAA+ superfamily predicted ATPase